MRLSFRVLSAIAAALIATFYLLPVIGRADSDLDPIFKDWEGRQKAHPRVKYVLEGTGTLQANAWGPGLPAESHTWPERRVIYIDFEKNLARKERRGEDYFMDDNCFFKKHAINMFDGKDWQQYLPRSDNEINKSPRFSNLAELELIPPTQPAMLFFDGLDSCVCMAHCCFGQKDNRAGNFRQVFIPVNRGFYRKLGSALHSNVDCIVLRSGIVEERDSQYYQIWVDPERQHVPLKVDMLAKEQPYVTWEMDYDQGTPPRLTAIRFGRYAEGTVSYEDDLKVTQFESPPAFDPALFHMDAVPGMVVQDLATDKRFRKGEAGKPDTPISLMKQSRSLTAVNMIITACILSVVAIATGFGWRQWKRRSLS